jgi:23S rRNA pseudouridine2605 synthase
MATRGRNSPGRGDRRSDARPGGQRGIKSPSAARDRARGARSAGARARPGEGREDVRVSRDEARRVGRDEVRPGSRDVARRDARNDRAGARPRNRQATTPGRSSAAGRSAAPPAHARGEPERLQKVLARMGVASRREAEEWIRAGRLTVNGQPAVLGTRVGRTDHLRLDGRLIHRHEVSAGQVYLCHRSPGENLRTPEEPSEHQALMDRLPRRAGNRFIAVSPMPRIDGGLEIVTSDGNLAVQLQRTVHSLPGEFSVRVRGELDEQTLGSIMKGTLDRGINLKVATLEAGGGEAANRWYTIVATGGSGKDVRQLFERHGALVSRVLRTKLGPLALDRELSRGQFRPLTPDEIQSLIASPAEPVPSEKAVS